MRGYITFDKMITPLIINVFFWLGVISVIVSSIGMMGFGIISKNGNFIQVIGGLLFLLVGPIIIRIYCEMLIVFFKMQKSLGQIKELLDKQRNHQVTNQGEID